MSVSTSGGGGGGYGGYNDYGNGGGGGESLDLCPLIWFQLYIHASPNPNNLTAFLFFLSLSFKPIQATVEAVEVMMTAVAHMAVVEVCSVLCVLIWCIECFFFFLLFSFLGSQPRSPP